MASTCRSFLSCPCLELGAIVLLAVADDQCPQRLPLAEVQAPSFRVFEATCLLLGYCPFLHIYMIVMALRWDACETGAMLEWASVEQASRTSSEGQTAGLMRNRLWMTPFLPLLSPFLPCSVLIGESPGILSGPSPFSTHGCCQPSPCSVTPSTSQDALLGTVVP